MLVKNCLARAAARLPATGTAARAPLRCLPTATDRHAKSPPGLVEASSPDGAVRHRAWASLVGLLLAAAVAGCAAGPGHAHDRGPVATSTDASAGGSDAVAAAQEAPSLRSAMDAPLFYQLLIGELELRAGEVGTAYQIILDAAQRTGDEALFRRSVEIALQARAGDQALAAVRSWRTARPESLEALRYQLQILGALNRPAETAEPLRTLLSLTPEAERGGAIAALPRFMQRIEPAQALTLMREVLAPWRDAAATRVPVRVALARGELAAGSPDNALALLREAHALDPAAPGPALLAMELMGTRPQAEALVLEYLARADALPALRLAYVRLLTGTQRYADAIVQLQVLTQQQPEEAEPYLSLGALHLELREHAAGEAALMRYLSLVDGPAAAGEAGGSPDRTGDVTAADDEEPGADAHGSSSANAGMDNQRALAERAQQGRVQAWLMLAQSAEQRSDFAAAEAWLARIDEPAQALEVQTRRAHILARQGEVERARALVREAPERSPADVRAKLVAEAGVLRNVQAWQAAFEVLSEATRRFVDDTDLLYEQAMMAEKIDRVDEMERLLRRVIALSPDNAHAYNALGYTLADRGKRLPEARELIVRALELAPGDPFITDSLGWVEFRLGNRDEALRLLQQAYGSRPDPEIGTHLGEVLWSLGRQDEARRVWREVHQRDADNTVLRDTLTRLGVRL
jgi:tetratricopeptide (TPR) repeat protein